MVIKSGNCLKVFCINYRFRYIFVGGVFYFFFNWLGKVFIIGENEGFFKKKFRFS